MANYLCAIFLLERLKKKARNYIGKSTECLESSDENRVTFHDIWVRFFREFDGFDDFERRLLELVGRGPYAIVISGFPNACAIYKLMNDYAQLATKREGRNNLIELADGGMLKLATLARDAVSWHLDFDDLVLVTLDIENSGRLAFLGERQPSKDATDLQDYLGRKTYDPSKDIKLVECS